MPLRRASSARILRDMAGFVRDRKAVIEELDANMYFAMSGMVEPHAADSTGLIGKHLQFNEVAAGRSKLAIDAVSVVIVPLLYLEDASDQLPLIDRLTLLACNDALRHRVIHASCA